MTGVGTKSLDVCLHLLVPEALAARIVDHLLEHPDWVGPFTTERVQGHGDPEGIASPAEQVRGRADRIEIDILMVRSHVGELVADLRADLPSPEVIWWLSPVLESGSLG